MFVTIFRGSSALMLQLFVVGEIFFFFPGLKEISDLRFSVWVFVCFLTLVKHIICSTCTEE